MTIFGALVTSGGTLERNPSDDPTLGTKFELIGPASNSAAGQAVTERTSLGMPAVWRAVNLIAGTAASLPLHAYRETTDGAPARSTTGQAADLIANPHPDMTSFEMWETVYAHMLLWGNAYLWIGRDRLGRIAELWPIHPSRVQVGRVSETGRKIYSIDGGEREHDDSTILHLPAFGYDGVCGVSPIRLARQGIGLALAAEEYGATLFGSGSLATGVLQTDQRLSNEQADNLQTRWTQKRQTGMKSAHQTMVLDSGAKFQQLSIAPEDAQFLESRKFQLQEIARIFGVPPHMLADTEGSTSWGTGIEQQSIGFVVYTLRPWLTRVEQRLTRLLRPQAVYARYSVEGLLRGDSAQRAAFYTAMRNLGALNADEIRALEERGPIPGGDAYWRPLNMGELGEPNPVSTATSEGVPA